MRETLRRMGAMEIGGQEWSQYWRDTGVGFYGC
jgi:hypothetical protein